jgi:DNA polymerase-1
MTTMIKRETASDPIILAPRVGEDTRPAAEFIIRAAESVPEEFFAIDVETTGLDWTDTVRTVQFGTPTAAVVFNVEEDTAHLDAAKYVLAWVIRTRRACTAHNASFDCLHLHKLGIVDGVDLLTLMTDTFILASIIQPPLSSSQTTAVREAAARETKSAAEELLAEFGMELSDLDEGEKPKKRKNRRGDARGLKALTADYLPESYSSIAQDAMVDVWEARNWTSNTGWAQTPLDDPHFLAYAGADVLDASRLCRVMYDIALNLFGPEVIRREHSMLRLAAKMQLRGFRVDREAIEADDIKLEAKQDALLERLRTFGIEKPNSTAQVADALAAEGAELPLTEKGTRSTAASILKLLTDSEIAPIILEYRALAKIRRAYLKSWLKFSETDGHLHPTVHPLRSSTGRFGMERPSLMNVGKAIRRYLLPSPGHVLLSADFSAVEVRISGAYAGDPVMMQHLLDNRDVYEVVAADAYGQNFTKADRNACKPILLGKIYGRGAESLARQNQTQRPDENPEALLSEAKKIMQAIQDRYRELSQFSYDLAGLTRIGVTRHELPSGRSVAIDPAWARNSLNSLVQATGRELLVDAGLALIDAGLEDYIWLSIHDEWLVEAPADRVEEFQALMNRVMTTEFRGVPIVATADVVGEHWDKV